MNDKLIFRFVAAISIVVFLLVVIVESKVIPVPSTLPSFTYFLPKLNAILNGSCSVLLVVSLFFIKRKVIAIHKALNIVAFCLSAVFLLSYVLFHYLAPQTVFGDLNGDGVLDAMEKSAVGGVRTVYLIILFTHIILAAIVLPLVLLSFNSGLQMQVEKHRKLVRWTFPIWLYVTVTGVVVYILISPYYHF
jgi:putative membrane protein